MGLFHPEVLMFFFVLLAFNKFDGYLKSWKLLAQKVIIFIPLSNVDIGGITRYCQLQNQRKKNAQISSPEASFAHVAKVLELKSEVGQREFIQSHVSLVLLVCVYSTLLLIKAFFFQRLTFVLLPSAIAYTIVVFFGVTQISLHLQYSEFRWNIINQLFPVSLSTFFSIYIIFMRGSGISLLQWLDFDLQRGIEDMDISLSQLVLPLGLSHYWISAILRNAVKCSIITMLLSFSLLFYPIIHSETQVVRMRSSLETEIGPLYDIGKHYRSHAFTSFLTHVFPLLSLLLWNPNISESWVVATCMAPYTFKMTRLVFCLSFLVMKLKNVTESFQYSVLYESKSLMHRIPSESNAALQINAANYKLQNIWVSSASRLVEYAIPFVILLLLLLPNLFVNLEEFSKQFSASVVQQSDVLPLHNASQSLSVCANCISWDHKDRNVKCPRLSLADIAFCERIQEKQDSKIKKPFESQTEKLNSLQLFIALFMPTQKHRVDEAFQFSSGISYSGRLLTVTKWASNLDSNIVSALSQSLILAFTQTLFVGCTAIYCAMFYMFYIRLWVTRMLRYESLWNDS